MSETATAMTCNELVELITEYLDGALPTADVARFEEHLQGCDGCRRYLEQMRQTIAALGHLPAEALAPEMQERLLAAFRDWRR